ncbi:hypothetical protein WN51_12993 [Melipona quadrifasciata]|uniref:Uncharacterized protein n=1 Tax=Melipona quadrifasciata TaxID=166423 RepID=A0A0M9AAG6_9HYME|nr:hypothetical protein WN51_12993 [Melipona quadrifasciata]
MLWKDFRLGVGVREKAIVLRFVSESLPKTHPVGALMAATPYPRRLLLQLPAKLDGPCILAVLPHFALFNVRDRPLHYPLPSVNDTEMRRLVVALRPMEESGADSGISKEVIAGHHHQDREEGAAAAGASSPPV